MPRGGARAGAGRPPGRKGPMLKEEVAELKTPVAQILPPLKLESIEDKDAAAQADEIMQHAGQMARTLRAAVKPDAVSDDPLVANYLKWANVVLRVASLLLPYQRPTYRSIEVRTDRGIEERATRFIGDPREEIAQLVIDVMIGEGNFV